MRGTSAGACLFAFALALVARTSNALTKGDYTYTVSDGKATIIGFNKEYSGALAITNSLGGYPVTSIGVSAFFSCTGLASVDIPASVVSIGIVAFADCSGLTTVNLSSSVTNIDIYAFLDCARLTSVVFQGNAPSFIDSSVFESTPVTIYYLPGRSGWGEHLGGRPAVLLPISYTVKSGKVTINRIDPEYSGNVPIPPTLDNYPVTAIGINAFYSKKGISVVTIPNSVSTIGDSAFRYSGLSSINIPGSIVSIGELTFNCCFSLTNLVIGIGVKSIRNNAFSNCWGLPSIIIPNSVTNIEGFAFADCYALTSVTLPASLKSIGGGAFGGCRSLIAIDVMEGNQHYSTVSGVLYDMQQQTIVCFPASKRGEYTIPASVTTVGEGAFFECMGLTAISIPDSVASIGDGAFYYCTSLKNVTIPHSVTNIGESAFLGCNRLSNIYFNGNGPTLGGSNTFYSTSATIYYLPGTTGWAETYGDRPTLCWNPTIPCDAEFGFLVNEFGFNINGTPNIPVVIEASTNLSSGLWVPILTNTLGDSGSIYFSDATSTGHAAKFYRIVWP